MSDEPSTARKLYAVLDVTDALLTEYRWEVHGGDPSTAKTFKRAFLSQTAEHLRQAREALDECETWTKLEEE